jgi:transposase-like protein
MLDNILQLNEDSVKKDLHELVRKSVEETLNELLELEAQELLDAGRYERSASRKGPGRVTAIAN